jgi:phosphoribosylformylglycinamidine (FGAM) synthase PurS component
LSKFCLGLLSNAVIELWKMEWLIKP